MSMNLAINDIPEPTDIIARISIRGLFILCIDETNRIAQFGAYEYENKHNLSILVTKQFLDGGSDPETVMLINSVPDGDIVFKVPKDDGSDKLAVFEKEGDERDFGLILNLNDDDLNQYTEKKVELIPDVITRMIQVENGVLYVNPGRTAQRTVEWAYKACHENDDFVTFGEVRGSGKNVAGEIWVDIRRVDELTMSLGRLKTPTDVGSLVTFKAGDAYYYQIEVTNICPDDKDDKSDNKLKPGKHSDFQFYYNALNVPVNKRLNFRDVEGAGGRQFPCDSLYVEGSPNIHTENN